MSDFPYRYEYPRPAVAVDLLVTRRSDASSLDILLIRRGGEPFAGSWALPGGFLDDNETLEDGAVRELREETGVTLAPADIVQFKAYSQIDRDPRTRVISVAFLASVPENTCLLAGDDAACVKWFPCSNLPSLAFDHGAIIEDFRRVRSESPDRLGMG